MKKEFKNLPLEQVNNMIKKFERIIDRLESNDKPDWFIIKSFYAEKRQLMELKLKYDIEVIENDALPILPITLTYDNGDTTTLEEYARTMTNG